MSGFSEREVQLMACAFQAMKTPPEIDYQVMARLAGMSHPGSASNAMRTIRRKLDARLPGTGTATNGYGNGGGASDTPGTPSKANKAKRTPRTGATGSKKRSVTTMMSTGSFFDNDDNDEEPDADAAVESPSKKKSKSRARAKGSEDDDGDAVKVKEDKRDEEEDGEDVDCDVEEV